MAYTHLSDLEITRQFLQQADPRLFGELVRRHQVSVLQQCRKLVKDQDDAYDVSQEVWIRVLKKLPQFQGERPFAAWLSVIVRNRCYDHLHENKRALHQEISQKIVNTLKDEVDTENATEPTVDILEELMEQLSGEEKLLLVLKYHQRWPLKDMAPVMQLSESAVKSKLFYTRKKLQKLLDKYRK